MQSFSRFVFALFAILLMSFGSAAFGCNTPGVKVGHPLPTDTSLPNYGKENPFFEKYGGQCTSFCWGRAKEKLGIDNLPTGDAQNWLKEAEAKGFQTGQEAQPNSIAVWSHTVDSKVDSKVIGGHVAFVEKVLGNTVYINEANIITAKNATNADWGGGYDGRDGIEVGVKTFSKGEMAKRQIYSVDRGPTQFLGYIYLPSPISKTQDAATSSASTQLPSFPAPLPCGTTENLTLTTDINVRDADVGNTGNTYLAFNFKQRWYFKSGTEWTEWKQFDNGAFPIYASGPLASQAIDVVSNENVSSLSGGQLYVGYGLTQSDMMENHRWSMVYTVLPLQTTTSAFSFQP